MKILGIETSCDETALCVLKAEGSVEAPRFKPLATALYSQIAIHKEYGGVFPMLAKREHGKNLVPLLQKLLKDTQNLKHEAQSMAPTIIKELEEILDREPELKDIFIKCISTVKKPDIDAIAVTQGPGLEPALWVGINFAKALEAVWNIPIIPVNHMEGHIVSPLLDGKSVEFPALSLLISGGHTELVLVKKWGDYTIVGETKDDAVGEAFDKVARMLELPYPGGPEISRLAEVNRKKKIATKYSLPRPMIYSDDYHFSFSGLKTAVLYTLKKIKKVTDEDKMDIAQEFEDAVTEVLISKTRRALEEYGARTLIVGGGVIANSFIRAAFEHLVSKYPDISLRIPRIELATDNAVMIAMAGYISHLSGRPVPKESASIKAEGNLRLSTK
jgi:N6-L-threonylcarbamoyladenine synthase